MWRNNMLKKIGIFGAVGVAFLATTSVAEAKVCFAVNQTDCGITIVESVEEKATKDNKCAARFNLTEVAQPEDENHVCTCEKCTDGDGTHYDCKCTEKNTECTDTCANHKWVEECSAGCTSTPFTPPENPEVTATVTECTYMGKICGKDCYQKKEVIGDGWWNSPCCNDNDCKSSSELPLFCFNGKCLECSQKSDCNVENSHYRAKFGNDGFYRRTDDGSNNSFRTPKQSYAWTSARYLTKQSCCNGECVAADCAWCNETHGASAKCEEGTKRTCETMGLQSTKPEGQEYNCTETTDDYGNTCYSCEEKCSPKECKVCTEIYNEKTCECEPVSEDCANLCFKFKFTNYEPLSKEECEAVKDQYGIKYCIDAEKDYFAGAVKTCGGIDEIPTEEEAFKLGQCMFNPNETYSTIYGQRYDGYFISYGGSGSDLADHVYVWLNWERDEVDHNAIIRMYDYRGTIPYYANKDGSLYYEATGAMPRNWYNNSILSRTLCRAH